MPLVPISTGGNSAISFVFLVARMVGLCMLYFVGVKEKAKSYDLRGAVCCIILVMNFSTNCGIFLRFEET